MRNAAGCRIAKGELKRGGAVAVTSQISDLRRPHSDASRGIARLSASNKFQQSLTCARRNLRDTARQPKRHINKVGYSGQEEDLRKWLMA